MKVKSLSRFIFRSFFFFLQIISQVAQYHLINHLDYVEMPVFTYIIFPCIFASVF